MSNRLTLLVDANWLLQSRAAVMMKNFDIDLSDISKEQSKEDLKELLARSICVILNRFPCVDNIVVVADGGSWRKQLPIPSQLVDTTYKGNRTQDSKIDWPYVYGALNDVLKNLKNIGVTVSQYNQIEGDDWVWYWSRRLNSDNINCLIWSSDNDLKQLIQIDGNTNAFTVWYNDKNGLWLHNSLEEPSDPLDFFMRMEYYSPILDTIRARVSEIHYINPNTVINTKVICGDMGDNIMPVLRYKRGERNFRITEKDWQKIASMYSIEDINDITRQVTRIATSILHEDKFAKLVNESVVGSTILDIAEMIDYNIKLVWLHESTIPDTIVQFMNQQEYKTIDIGYIRSNYKVMSGSNSSVEDLFNSI